ncbi:MAG: bacillithiol transferase BstA [Acidobacteriia bacterium]|nr:bacillithiol transferase BstA [Terriglobia bacterium]
MDPRFPIGKFSFPTSISPEQREQWISAIGAAPAQLRASLAGLSGQQLDTPYRDGGWTVRQVIHHVPESHMNAYIRFKLALTEEEPTVKPYDEAAWARLPDVVSTPMETSLAMLDALHDRWVRVLRSIDGAQWQRTFRHPEIGLVKLEGNLALYAWHGKHHTAHITSLRERMNW